MKFCTALIVALFTLTSVAFAGNVAFTDYTLVGASLTAYVTAIAATPITVSQMYVCDTSGQIIKIASGASGSEVDLFTAPVSGCQNIAVSPYLVAGTRLSVKRAGSTSPSTGANTISLLP